jgi:hypothetical protein
MTGKIRFVALSELNSVDLGFKRITPTCTALPVEGWMNNVKEHTNDSS